MKQILSCICMLSLGWGIFAHQTGCADPLLPPSEQMTTDSGPQDGPPTTRPVPGNTLETKDLGNGVTQARINSSDEAKWLYFSFATGKLVDVKDAATSKAWDLGFQRFKITSNSGISGTGGVEVAIAEDQTFDAITHAPKEGYIQDAKDGNDEDTDPDFAFLAKQAWYAYNPADHTLSARKRVYIVKTTAGNYVKVQMLKYYDDNGNSGFPTFKWANIEPPKDVEPPKPTPKATTTDLGDGIFQTVIDSSDKETWVYFSFSYSRDIEVKDPSTSKEWDLAFQRYTIKTNGGISGSGGVEVAIVEGKAFDTIQYAPREGYIKDEKDGSDTDDNPDLAFLVQNAWYSYNPQTHALSARDRIYIIKTTEGNYIKLQMTGYNDKEGKPGFPTFKWAKIRAPQPAPPTGPKVVTKDLGSGVTEVRIVASEASTWIYYSIDTNAEVTPKEPDTSTEWTLKFQRFAIRINGGISGKGDVEAQISKETDFDAIKKAPKDGYTTDKADGPDEDTEADLIFSIENGWYVYDPKTHTLAARDRIYIIKANGNYYKLKMISYYFEKQPGFPTFKWAKIDPPE